MFPSLCRSMSGRHSSITSSCRGGRGRRRRGRGRRSIWLAGKGSETTARVTPLGITTTIKVTAANHAPGVEEGVAGQTNPRGPALCWPTITWWSWSRSSHCRASSPRVVPAPRSRPPAVSQSCPASWASSSSSHLRIRRRVLRPLWLPLQLPTPRQQHRLHRHHLHLHHQVAALRSVLSHPAKPSTLGNCLTLGNLREGRVWTGLRCPDPGKDHHHRHQTDNQPGLTWTAFRMRSPRLEGRSPRTDIQQTWTRPGLKSSSSRGQTCLWFRLNWRSDVFTVRKGLTYPLCCRRPCVEVLEAERGEDEPDERWP